MEFEGSRQPHFYPTPKFSDKISKNLKYKEIHIFHKVNYFAQI